ncbi:MAG: OmpA family protein [Pirellulaceae bacterium]|nr:OmpA family protein [Pirellulaceae bacterium]
MAALGCNRNPYQQNPYAAMGTGLPPAQQAMMGNPMAQAIAPQIADLQRRVQVLDDTNRSLTTQLAQAQQQMQVARDRADLLAKQLQDTTGQLQQSLLAQRQTESQALGMQASMNKRGGAKLTANNSIPITTNTPSAPEIPGARVIQDGDLIRIRIPADQLFSQGTAQLISSGSYLIDQVASTIGSQYGRQRVAVEGHTDTGALYGGTFSNPTQLAGAQAQAVIDQLIRRNNLPASQLFVVAHGPNHPIGDNQTAAGRADNRRIEIVIYPEMF